MFIHIFIVPGGQSQRVASLSLHHVGYKALRQAIRLSDKHLYLLSHLSSLSGNS